MKKQYIYIYIIGILAILLSACNKENVQTNENNLSDDSDIKVVDLNFGDKQNIQMLYFSSEALFDQTCENLISEIETIEDNFVANYSTLNEEQLNTKEEEIEFNYQQPLIDFENQYGYESSMRQSFVAAEETWLNNENLDPTTDPNNIYGFDIIEMTLLNTEGEVKIGDKILKLTKNGFAYILDGSLSTLISIREGDLSVLEDANVISNIDLSKSSDCKGWKSQNPYDDYTSNKRVYKYRHFHSYPWKGSSLVKLSSYKKSGNRWKKHRMMLSVKNVTYFKNNNCDQVGTNNTGWKHKNRKVLRQYTNKNGAFPQYRAKNGASVSCRYQYAGSGVNEVLSW